MIQQWLKTAPVNQELRKILNGKVSALNQAPQGLVLRRLLEVMGFAISDAEIQAWKHRNMAAHRGFSKKPEEVILNSKVLRCCSTVCWRGSPIAATGIPTTTISGIGDVPDSVGILRAALPPLSH